MSEHPIRIVVRDDLDRSRLTVFFRGILIIPHYIWAFLWSIAAFFAVLASWVVTLITARSPQRLHAFLASFVKYITQIYAYLYLAADPYPPFDGRDGYPVDLVIAGPERQSRLRVAFRIILLIPAGLLAGGLVGMPGLNSFTSSGSSAHGRSGTGFSSPTSIGLLFAVAVLGWFAILVRGRMPRGLRDTAAYCISYGAQFWGYALLLTDRYPNADPLSALEDLPVRADPIHFELEDDLRRSRLTVFFRLLLAIPHFLWLYLWGILVFFAVILNWLGTLLLGRSPELLHRFLSAFLRYQFHVYGFLNLTANPFPGFTGRRGSYPLEVIVAERARQSRWKVLFRLILAIPALILWSTYNAVATIAAILAWFASLATGRMPLGLRNLGALALRYEAQTVGYLMLLSDSYPYSGPFLNGEPEAEPEPTAPELAPAPESPLPSF